MPTVSDSHHQRGVLHEAHALRAQTLAERRGALREALAEHRLALQAATAVVAAPDITRAAETSACAGLAWLRAATVCVMQGDLGPAAHACRSAREQRPDSREAQLLEAEIALLTGEHQRAMQLLLPCLDQAPDGWVLAALAAYAGELLQQMARLMDEATARLPHGFVAPHRRERWQDAVALFGILRAAPSAGEGPYGQLAALMCGDYRRVAGGGLRGADVVLVTRQLRALLLAGRTDLLVPLLREEADAFLPGIGELVNGVVGGIAAYLPPS